MDDRRGKSGNGGKVIFILDFRMGQSDIVFSSYYPFAFSQKSLSRWDGLHSNFFKQPHLGNLQLYFLLLYRHPAAAGFTCESQ